VETNVSELSDQVGENARVTKEHTGQIASNATKINDTSSDLQTAKGDIRSVDTKAGGAMTAAESARAGVAETGKRVEGLSAQFENRNNYAVSAENSVLFGFNSAKLQPEFHTVLDNLAQKVKQGGPCVAIHVLRSAVDDELHGSSRGFASMQVNAPLRGSVPVDGRVSSGEREFGRGSR